jgi:hypothetical protein
MRGVSLSSTRALFLAFQDFIRVDGEVDETRPAFTGAKVTLPVTPPGTRYAGTLEVCRLHKRLPLDPTTSLRPPSRPGLVNTAAAPRRATL